MEAVAPLLELIWSLRSDLEEGVSVRAAILRACEKGIEAAELGQFLSLWSQNLSTLVFRQKLRSPQRALLYNLLERGLRGESIIVSLKELEDETLTKCEEEVDGILATMPYKMMFPLFFLQLPAFLMLLFGPILQNLLISFESF